MLIETIITSIISGVIGAYITDRCIYKYNIYGDVIPNRNPRASYWNNN